VRLLVTGASGFTGGHLARIFARGGHHVRALVRQSSQRAALNADGIETVLGSLDDGASLKRAVAGVDVVYNIAALYRDAGMAASKYHEINAAAVGTLIEAAAGAGATRLVHCSTVGVHGDIEYPPANEDAPLRPGDVYQRTKVEGERIAREAAARTGLPVTIARPSGIYGPGDRRLLKLFKGVARGRFVVLGSGDIFYHLTYIDDLVEGLRLCGEVPAAANRTYILAGPEVTTLNELIAIIAAESGTRPPALKLPVWPVWIAGALCEALCAPLRIPPPLYRRRVDFFTKSRAFDISRARTELGYAPQYGLAGPQGGIRRTLTWYREHGWL
jgi:nucleoside-diphosphate-sugar epimerase